MSDPDYKPAQHNRKGSLFYNVKENSKRRSVTYQLLKLKEGKKDKEISSDSSDVQEYADEYQDKDLDQDQQCSSVEVKVRCIHTLILFTTAAPPPHPPSIPVLV